MMGQHWKDKIRLIGNRADLMRKCYMRKQVTYPTDSELRDYIGQCSSAVIALCQKRVNEWAKIYQSNEQEIAAKRNELSGYYGLDVAQQKLGELRCQQDKPSVFQRLKGIEKLEKRIRIQEELVSEIEAKIEKKLESDRSEIHVSLQILEHMNDRDLDALTKALKQWQPQRSEPSLTTKWQRSSSNRHASNSNHNDRVELER